jgi:hypothetical protein
LLSSLPEQVEPQGQLRDQVRQMIMKDDRFKAIKSGKVHL